MGATPAPEKNKIYIYIKKESGYHVHRKKSFNMRTLTQSDEGTHLRATNQVMRGTTRTLISVGNLPLHT